MQCVGVLSSDLASSLKVKVWLAASYGLLSVSRNRLGQVSTTMLHMTLMRPPLAPPDLCRTRCYRSTHLGTPFTTPETKPYAYIRSSPQVYLPLFCRPNLALSPTDDQGAHGVDFLFKEPKPRHTDRRGRRPLPLNTSMTEQRGPKFEVGPREKLKGVHRRSSPFGPQFRSESMHGRS